MNTAPFAVYYHPGARGDFLAAILCDTLHKHNSQAKQVFRPGDYLKIHSMIGRTLPESTNLIYIAPESDLDLLYIAHYHILKNKPRDGDIGDWYDQYEMELKNVHQWVLDESFDEKQANYVIGFSLLGNPDALCDFYYAYHREHIGTEKNFLIKENILVQDPIDDLNIFKIFSLFVYEKENNLLRCARNFSLNEFLESKSPYSFCNVNCYNFNEVRTR